MGNEEMRNDKPTTDKLVIENMGYVVTLARQYKSDILSTDDLVSEGSIGLMKAAEKFDSSRGKPFVTFAAPYIRRSIENAIRRVEKDAEVRSTDESLPVGSRNNYTLLNVLEDTNAPKTDALLEQAVLSDDLIQVVGILNEREQQVVRRFFGIGAEKQTMVEIARALGMTRERVRQIRNQSLRKLRKATKENTER